MSFHPIEEITILRIAVGFLGERNQFGWWQSSFFTEGSSAFLSPVFNRTQLLAQCNGVTRAAALVHDERIGVGNVYHLFRLPEELEQGIHQTLHDIKLEQQIQEIIVSKVSALDYLRKNSTVTDQPQLGPMLVGNVHKLRDHETWKVVCGLYYISFENQKETLPYFKNS